MNDDLELELHPADAEIASLTPDPPKEPAPTAATDPPPITNPIQATASTAVAKKGPAKKRVRRAKLKQRQTGSDRSSLEQLLFRQEQLPSDIRQTISQHSGPKDQITGVLSVACLPLSHVAAAFHERHQSRASSSTASSYAKSLGRPSLFERLGPGFTPIRFKSFAETVPRDSASKLPAVPVKLCEKLMDVRNR